MKVPWTDSMGELSGMGEGYEQACRDMLVTLTPAGLRLS